MKKRLLLVLLALCLVLTGCSTKKTAEPIALTVWHYYNGAQQENFQAQVNAFNRTVGLENNIVVTAQAMGSIGALHECVTDAFAGKVGAFALPDLFASYTDTAWDYAQQGRLADLAPYCTQEELDALHPAYVAEGRLGYADKLFILPTLKSTEALYLNWTAWEPFAAACGVTTDDLTTWEGLGEVAEKYYQWSGGKHFFGRDAYANYLLVGSVELGDAVFQTNGDQADFHLNAQVFRRMWDCFCVPYAKGYFDAAGRYRSDDMKTGELIAYVGSTSSASFTPTKVTDAAGQSTDITVRVLPAPSFAGVETRCAVQQGAGMAVVKSTEAREKAAMVFLRYLIQPDVNLSMALASGYMPVTISAAAPESIRAAMAKAEVSESSIVGQSLLVSAETVFTRSLVYAPPFQKHYQARNLLANLLSKECTQLRTQYDAALAAGSTPEDAAAQCLGDEAFNQWLATLSDTLGAL